MRDNMRILEEINAVTEEERIAATQLAESATFRTFSPFEVRRHVAIFLEQYADNKGPEATVKADSLRILAEAVYDEAQEIYKMSNEYQARSVSLQHELDWLKLDLSVSHEQARNQARQEVAQELREVQAEVEHLKATHISNEIYTKKLREISKLKEQRTEAQTQAFLLETENEELKRRIQELTK